MNLDNSEMCIYVGVDRRWAEVGVIRDVPLQEWAMCLDRQWRMYTSTFNGKKDGQGPQQKQKDGQGSQRRDGTRPNYGQRDNRGQWVPRYDYTAQKDTRNTNDTTKDPNAMDVDKTRGRAPPQNPNIKCYKCGKLGHISRYCPTALDLRAMTYEDIAKYFRETEKEEEKKEDF